MSAIVTLTAYNMGDVTESDFDAWVGYVSQRVADMPLYAGVEIDAYPFEGGPDHDTISGADDEEEEQLRALLRNLWDDFCSGVEVPS